MWLTVIDTTSPLAHAGEDIVIRQGERVFFDGLNSSDNLDVVNWTWNFTYLDTDIRLYEPLPEYVFQQPGTYVVTLIVVDRAGNYDVDTMTVTILSKEESNEAMTWVWLALTLIAVAGLAAIMWMKVVKGHVKDKR